MFPVSSVFLILTILTFGSLVTCQRVIKVLPDEELRRGSPEKGFRDKNGKLIPYNDIWESEPARDGAHKRYNRHFGRGITNITNEDTSLEKDMLIYVVLLIFLIIPYTGMVLCRKFCPQILHGGASAAEARAKREEEERLKKAKHSENKKEKGMVEIDLTKRKKEKGNQIVQIATPTKALVKFSHAHHRQQQFEQNYQHTIEVGEKIINSTVSNKKLYRKSKKSEPLNRFFRAKYHMNKVTPVDDKFLQRVELVSHSGQGDVKSKDKIVSHLYEPFRAETSKIINDREFGDGGGDQPYSEDSRKYYAQKKTKTYGDRLV